MAWGKAGSTTLGTAGDNVSVTCTASINNQILFHKINDTSSGVNPNLTFNSDSGSNYTQRNCTNGGSESTLVNQAKLEFTNAGVTPTSFVVGYTLNVEGEEKLNILFDVEEKTAGANNAPNRIEHTSKWVNTSSQITTVNMGNDDSGDYAIGSNLTVLGSDLTPAAAIPFAENSQVGSRAEIIDTRKIYYRDDVDFKELDGNEATNYRSESWYEQLSGETP